MDDAGFVRGVERIGNLARVAKRLVDANGPTRDPIGERLAVDELENQRRRAGVIVDAVNRRDIGMIERREHARLTLEAHQAVGVGGDRRRDDLDRDVAAQPRVARAIDLAHPAGTDQRDDVMAADPRSRRERHLARLYGARPLTMAGVELFNCPMEAPMITGIRVAVLVGMLAAPSAASAQGSAPAAPDVLKELLVEVRALRLAMERAATVGARIQLLVARVQMQEQRIAELSRRATVVREEVGQIDTIIAQQSGMMKQFERSADSRANPDEQRELEGMVEMHKQQIAIAEKRRQELLSEEAQLAQQIAADQGRWSDVNSQLDELERSLTPKR